MQAHDPTSMNADGEQSLAKAYQCDGRAVDAMSFTRAACDPQRSVVVEACAGSGKTWLLVARMLRSLLAGAEPSELLAITFTRKAAQEMRHRLMELLRELALADAEQAAKILRERGVAESELASCIPRSRQLYEDLLNHPQGLSMDTFHSWFGRLLQLAPLASGVPQGFQLLEATGQLQRDAWRSLLESLGLSVLFENSDTTTQTEAHRESRNDQFELSDLTLDAATVRAELLYLFDTFGDYSSKELLDAFLDKRAEWWAYSLNSADSMMASDEASSSRAPQQALLQLQDFLGEDAFSDARVQLWRNELLLRRIGQFALWLGKGGVANQERALKIETAISTAQQLLEQGETPSPEHFAALATEFYDDKANPRKNGKVKNFLAALAEHFGSGVSDPLEAFNEEFNRVAAAIRDYERRAQELDVVRVNQALFIVGQAYLDQFQRIKAQQGALDFSDLEWQAYRLLSQEQFAAYLLGRLDSRYKHILLDEFQDTNPLQWSIVRSWLDAYGDDHQRPTVFVVGDPKQSIYRFRRADPRVFTAAQEMLAAQGARILKTNQTRRNAPEVVEVLNQAMLGNALFAPQTTLSTAQGQVLRLPLISSEESDEGVANGLAEPLDGEIAAEVEDPADMKSRAKKKKQSELAPITLRDPLTTPAESKEDLSRYREGQQVAALLHQMKQESAISNHEGSDSLHWSDVMLLVRRRSHLPAYERALREAGIPFVSNRRGGLLETLEIQDLLALLNFLMTPSDNRALAHVLKSPIFGASDDDLLDLAQIAQGTWWQKLQYMAEQLVGDQERTLQDQTQHESVFVRAQSLLQQWMQAAHELPVHDVLDQILHQGDVLARYAQRASDSDRAQVLGNVMAFLELALNLDGGRYPSLPKFIASVMEFDQGAESESPDESNVVSGVDAVQILTIHSAKGLEAKVVIMLDSNHSEASKDKVGVLCAWPLRDGEAKHFSVFGRVNQRGKARDALFASEEQQAAQENLNLLYVAVTRAKQTLVLTGIVNDKKTALDAEEAGVARGSWYQRFLHLPVAPASIHPSNQTAEVVSGVVTAGSGIENAAQTLQFEGFNPPDLSLPVPEAEAPASEAQVEGIALHALMERLTLPQQFKIGTDLASTMPTAETIAQWLPCALSVASKVREQALTILQSEALAPFFDSGLHEFSRNEMDILFAGELLRLDRLVVFKASAQVYAGEVWILDYKRNLLISEQIAYQQQMAQYRQALAAVYPDRHIRIALILVDGRLHEFEAR